ncbi:unnamed protein product [Ilex paraguariensis]|uniref:Myb-like domain-containing protein n=1 Tax=Ilex paraguariensis TaxID=185542 RepID=A0ABC8RQB4_9AQUA
MDKRPQKKHSTCSSCCYEEVNSIEWKFINMTEQEKDLIYRMHKLVGDRWGLRAGRIPEEIERFWLMRHNEGFTDRQKVYSKNKF